MTSARILDDLREEAPFHREEVVRPINWWIPEDTYERLRKESISTSGTTHHMGQIATEAMAASIQDDAENTRHKTWVRLKESYDYSGTGYDVGEWTYRNYVDYSKEPDVEKTALNVSVPKSIVADFTKGLQQNAYGEALANALDAELSKRRQIMIMHKLIDQMHGRVSEVDEKEVNVDGTPIDVNELRMHHTGAEMVLERGDVRDYRSRRGAIMAELRANYTKATKRDIYALSEKYGVSSRPTKRKDYEAILKHVREDDVERFAIHPSLKVRRKLETHNLPHFIEHKRSNILLGDVEDDERLEDAEKLSLSIYDTTKKSEEEAWRDIIDPLYSFAVFNVIDPVWRAMEDASMTNGYEVARAKADTLPKLEEVVQNILKLVREQGDEEQVIRVVGLLNLIQSDLDKKPENLETAWETKKKRDKQRHTNKDKRGDDLPRRGSTFTW